MSSNGWSPVTNRAERSGRREREGGQVKGAGRDESDPTRLTLLRTDAEGPQRGRSYICGWLGTET